MIPRPIHELLRNGGDEADRLIGFSLDFVDASMQKNEVWMKEIQDAASFLSSFAGILRDDIPAILREIALQELKRT